MPSNDLRPSHQALRDRMRPGARAFVAKLIRENVPTDEVALFALDLRSLEGLLAGVHVYGADWVEQRTKEDRLPMFVFPLVGLSDIAAMVQLVAPELMPVVGRRPRGTIEVVLVAETGEAAMAWLSTEDLLRDCG